MATSFAAHENKLTPQSDQGRTAVRGAPAAPSGQVLAGLARSGRLQSPSRVPAIPVTGIAETRGDEDPNIARAQGGGGGGGGAGGGGGGPAPPAASATMVLSGDSYVDTATASHKNIKYNVTWSGGSQGDYLIVQWLKGYIKDPKGKPFKVSMYDKLTDFDFADWQIDSVDADPAYWSDATGRWNYTVEGPNKFSATDDPNPPSWANGTDAQVDFKTAVYKTADVPVKTTGSIAATPLSAFQPWSFHATMSGGKFTH